MISPQDEGRLRRSLDRSLPFTIQLLGRNQDRDASVSSLDNRQLMLLLPATYHTESDDLAATSCHVNASVRAELDLQRLNKVSRWLWVAGRLVPPRPLHYQLLLRRDVFVTEQMDMHLVWMTGRIFVKPIPRFLLDSRFWKEHLRCNQPCGCVVVEGVAQDCEHRRLWKCALGFLFSYAALIRHESDFLLAKEKHLLPEEITWPDWISFVKELRTEHIYPDIDPRFYHGELRLSRLNKLYFLSQTPLYGYMPYWNQYSTFLRDNFAWLAGTTVYIAVVLTAMQVGLATDALSGNGTFQSVSYGFTVFSILGPLVGALLILLAFCFVFIYNLATTISKKRERFRRIRGGSSHN